VTAKKKYSPEIDDSEELKKAVEHLHNCSAQFIAAVEVAETYEGQPVWHGIVQVFEIAGNPHADRCYAWSSPIEGSTKRKFFAVLAVPPVTSAKDAVKAAIIQEHRTR